MKKMILPLTMLIYGGSTEAQTYLCVADKATGFSFNKSKKDWEITHFDVTDDKYILTQKYSDIQKGMRWTWTKVGEKSGATCDEKEGFNDAGVFRCDFFSIILMNRYTLRFQETYPYGYPGPFQEDIGASEGANKPYIEIGRCSEMQ